jgi:hypothetical protein
LQTFQNRRAVIDLFHQPAKSIAIRRTQGLQAFRIAIPLFGLGTQALLANQRVRWPRWSAWGRVTVLERDATARNLRWHDPTAKTNFANHFNVIWVVQSPLVKIFRLTRRANQRY